MSDVIARMLANRRLERVAVNSDYAVTVIEMAKQHVRTAEALAGSDDQAMAFTVAVDTARKALVAVLATKGFRVRPVGGAHRNTGVAPPSSLRTLHSRSSNGCARCGTRQNIPAMISRRRPSRTSGKQSAQHRRSLPPARRFLAESALRACGSGTGSAPASNMESGMSSSAICRLMNEPQEGASSA